MNYKSLSFTSPHCLKNCAKLNTQEGRVCATEKGYAYAAPTENELQEALNRVPTASKEFLPIMASEATATLPEHTTCGHAIDLKQGTIPPWGRPHLRTE